MSDPLLRLQEDRQARDAARANLESGFDRFNRDLRAKGLVARASDRARQEAKDLGGKVLDIAGESKGIIAATSAAILLWLLRGPLIALVQRNFGTANADEPPPVQASDSDPAR